MSFRPLRLHIGHHFFGSGNVGDDLMLAGFLAGVAGDFTPSPGKPGEGGGEGASRQQTDQNAPSPRLSRSTGRGAGAFTRLSCCSPTPTPSAAAFAKSSGSPTTPAPARPRSSMRTRGSASAGRRFSSSSAPGFSTTSRGAGLLQHHGKPMYFLGVGVNERAALEHPAARAVLEYASHIWTRDEQSTRWIAKVCGSEKVTEAADLAHVAMRTPRFLPVEEGVAGYVLNFEETWQFRDKRCAT